MYVYSEVASLGGDSETRQPTGPGADTSDAGLLDSDSGVTVGFTSDGSGGLQRWRPHVDIEAL